MELGDALRVSSNDTLRFFYSELRETPPAETLSQEVTLHMASILAHFSLTSCVSTSSLPAPRHLTEVLDRFLLCENALLGQELLHMAGAQILYLNGFHRVRMMRRHNVKWFDQLGRSFYQRAIPNCAGPRQRKLFGQMSEGFETCTRICCDLERRLRGNQLNRFLISH